MTMKPLDKWQAALDRTVEQVEAEARTAVLADLSAEMSRVTILLADGQEAVLMSDLYGAIHRRMP